MGNKKTWSFAWVLVFIGLLCVGCGEEVKPTEEPVVMVEKTQEERVEDAISKVVETMRPDGDVANTYRVQRSLALHILADHLALIAHFQSQNFEAIAKLMGDRKSIKVFRSDENGEPIWWEGDIDVFWRKLYEDKRIICGEEVYIELQIYSEEITLIDVIPMADGIDCEALEAFKFHVVCKDKEGNIISNARGGGEIGLKHSEDCVWEY